MSYIGWVFASQSASERPKLDHLSQCLCTIAMVYTEVGLITHDLSDLYSFSVE